MASPTKMRLLLLASEWKSKRGGLSTFNRELAIHLAKSSDVQVSVFVPECDQEEKDVALKKNVVLIQATKRPGFDDETKLLCFPPKELQIDCVIGHGVVLGHPAQIIQERRDCKWIQFVHTDPEELGMFKDYPDAISKAEKKHRDEVDLCVMADCVVAVGPKLADAYNHYLRHSEKDQNLLVFTPGIFSEFDNAMQSKREGGKCRVLAFGRGDAEDFSLKGFDIAAEAVGKLKDAHLIFVGAHDKIQEEVASRFKEYNIPPSRLRVRTYIETRERLKNQFSEVDLAIMPSRTEGFGLVALEAMSACLPILVSNNSGFGEVLKKVRHGSQYVIDSDDAEEWAKNIERVWNKDRELRLEEAEDVRNSYGKKYSWEEQCSVLVEKIKSMLNAPPASLKRKSSHSEESVSISSEKDEGASIKEQRSVKKRKADSLSSSSSFSKKRKPVVSGASVKEQPTVKKRKGNSLSSSSSFSKKRKPVVSGVTVKEKCSVKKRKADSLSSSRSSPKKRKPVLTVVIKDGVVKDEKLEELSEQLGNSWEKLARRLKFTKADITRFHKDNDEYAKKALGMLEKWKEKCGSDATYRVLYKALRHPLVQRRDLAEQFCIPHNC